MTAIGPRLLLQPLDRQNEKDDDAGLVQFRRFFLLDQAQKPNNTAFMALLGKVIPLQVTHQGGTKITVEIVKHGRSADQIAELLEPARLPAPIARLP